MRIARRVAVQLAEPLTVISIVLALVWGAQHVVTPVRVGGWSMGPTLAPGDIVLVRRGERPVPGDVVLVASPGHQPFLHRVTQLADDGSVTTKGDANPVADRDPATTADVVGCAIAVVPLGSLIARWRGQPVYATIASQPNSTRR